MRMVDDRLLEKKLGRLHARVARAKARLPSSREQFLADQDAQEIVSFNVLLAMQEALDIAAHWIADAGWDVPTTAREHFELLASHGVVPPELARDLAACAGARNLIAHAYGSVDLGRLYAEAPAALVALECFAATLAQRGG
jgi:uncharacterized protein YutE (UPF0331/DUF86 family)